MSGKSAGLNPATHSMDTGIFPGLKRPRLEVEHSLPSITTLSISGAVPQLPPVYLRVHSRDKFCPLSAFTTYVAPMPTACEELSLGTVHRGRRWWAKGLLTCALKEVYTLAALCEAIRPYHTQDSKSLTYVQIHRKQIYPFKAYWLRDAPPV